MTNASKIYPLIICGGKGTRLWPISRTQSPKQFQKIGGADSLTFFQSAVERHSGPLYHPPIIVTGAIHKGTVEAQLAEMKSEATILCEPFGRNTGPAVLAAAEATLRHDPDAVFVVIPADHVIEGDLASTMGACLPAANAGKIVTFGITPRYAESGFGYIVDGGDMEGTEGVRRVDSFVEKPPLDVAEKLVSGRKAYWASGISMFSARTIIGEYAKFDPETAGHVRDSVLDGEYKDGALYLAPESFGLAEGEPTESTIFERSDRVALAPLDVDWNDVGSWNAMYGIAKPDENGNVLQGDVIALDATNTMVRSSSDRLISVVGLSDVIIVDTPDALLITRMDGTQNVKKVVERLKSQARPEAEHHVEAGPKVVPMPAPAAAAVVATVAQGPNPLMDSDRFQLGTAEVGVGKAMTLEAGQGRQVIVVDGEVRAEGQGWTKTIKSGGRVYSDPLGSIDIRNIAGTPAELLFLTIEDADMTHGVMAKVANG